jgi:RimJ/RimL family protein N-acetyltransferase
MSERRDDTTEPDEPSGEGQSPKPGSYYYDDDTGYEIYDPANDDMDELGEPTTHQLFDMQPHLIGEMIEVRPLKPEDWDGLYAVASDPLIWEQHPANDRYREEVFREFFREALESGGALVVIDRTSQKVIGSSRYFGFDPVRSEIEIGWTFLARAYWGGRYNGELKRLMLDHAFTFVESVVFMIGPTNTRSRNAVERIGGVLTERKQSANLNGRTVEHVVYEIRRPSGPL